MAAHARAWRLAPAAVADNGAAGAADLAADASTIPDLVVVSYNVLADQYAPTHAGYCAAEELAWAARGPRLLADALALGADLLALQARRCGAGDKGAVLLR
jgi:mRNA deadenylase 3'-5' endonuclease subunit Ccr4